MLGCIQRKSSSLCLNPIQQKKLSDAHVWIWIEIKKSKRSVKLFKKKIYIINWLQFCFVLLYSLPFYLFFCVCVLKITLQFLFVISRYIDFFSSYIYCKFYLKQKKIFERKREKTKIFSSFRSTNHFFNNKIPLRIHVLLTGLTRNFIILLL